MINEQNLDALARIVQLARTAHVEANGQDGDLLVGLQLTHSGRYSFRRPILAHHDPLLDPRTVVDKQTGATAGPDFPLISDAELDAFRITTMSAAALAARAGFDFVDLKQCHRYLLNELLSGTSRPGKYGGSFENRTRFIREVASRIRETSPSLIVATRLNVYDGLPFAKGPDGRGASCPFDTPVRCAWGTEPSRPVRSRPG